MWKIVILLCLLSVPAVAEQQRVVLGNRSYLAEVPARPNGGMILALHNAAGDPDDFRSAIRLSGPALAEGYVVIYPQGLGKSWNGLYCCGQAQIKRTPDIQFLDKVIADATTRYGVTPGRVYLTGMGNGSVMAETYATRRAGKVRAVAGVAGIVDTKRAAAGPVAFMHIHGLDDKVTPYGVDDSLPGSKSNNVGFPPVHVQIAAFVRAHGGLAKTVRVIDRVNDGTSVRQVDYTDAGGRVKVRLFTVIGGGHVWPGPQRKGAGNTRDISATTEVLRFFGLHP